MLFDNGINRFSKLTVNAWFCARPIGALNWHAPYRARKKKTFDCKLQLLWNRNARAFRKDRADPGDLLRHGGLKFPGTLELEISHGIANPTDV